MRYTDAHTHLNSDELYAERESHLQAFVERGGVGLVNIGVDQVWNERGIEIAEKSALQYKHSCIVKATVGGHPSEVSYGNITSPIDIDGYIFQLQELIETHRSVIVAVGECGMDAHYTGYTPAVCFLQQTFFRKQCVLAREYNLPVVIHSRDAFEATYEVLEEFADLPIYMHCRGYNPDQAEKMIARFPQLRFGFCGNITYPKAESIRDSFRFVVNHDAYKQGLLGVLIETDAPWLAPQGRRGQRHTPRYIDEQYVYASKLADSSVETFTERVLIDRERLYMRKKV